MKATLYLSSTESGFQIVESGRRHFMIYGATIEETFLNAARFYTKVDELNKEITARMAEIRAKDTQ